jgi:phage terminase small subunit
LLRPGSHVPDSAKTVFQEIVASVRDGHFQPIDRPLLEQYAIAISIAREVAQAIDDDGVVVDGRVHPAAKFLKTQQALCGQLASRLRLCTQNRMSKERATTGAYGGAESIAELYERAK